MKIKILIGIILYMLLSIFNAGFIFAKSDDWIYNNYCHTKLQSYFKEMNNEREQRGRLAFAIGWSLFPLTTIITPFVTEFYYSGWRLTTKYESC